MSIYHNYQAVAKSGLGIDNFFSINVSKDEVTLMAWNNGNILEICKKLGYIFYYDNESNWLKSNNNELISIIIINKP